MPKAKKKVDASVSTEGQSTQPWLDIDTKNSSPLAAVAQQKQNQETDVQDDEVYNGEDPDEPTDDVPVTPATPHVDTTPKTPRARVKTVKRADVPPVTEKASPIPEHQDLPGDVPLSALEGMKPKEYLVDITFPNEKNQMETKKIDLLKPCPAELYKRSYKDKPYIPVKIVRAVMRALDCVIIAQDSRWEVGSKYIIFEASVKVFLPRDQIAIVGVGTTAIDLGAFCKAEFGQSGRVRAVAVKDALKQRFPFFEGDYGVMDEDDAETMDSVANDIAEDEKKAKAKSKNESADAVPPATPAPEEKKEEPRVLTQEALAETVQAFVDGHKQVNNGQLTKPDLIRLIAPLVWSAFDPHSKDLNIKQQITTFFASTWQNYVTTQE